MSTQVHNDGCECGMCRWANSTVNTVAISAPDFEHEWLTAPESHRRYTEQSEASYWFQRGLWLGIQYERERGLVVTGQDLREMQRMARERVGR